MVTHRPQVSGGFTCTCCEWTLYYRCTHVLRAIVTPDAPLAPEPLPIDELFPFDRPPGPVELKETDNRLETMSLDGYDHHR